MFTKEVIALTPKVVEAIKKIAERQEKEWEWQPEVGERCLWQNKPYVICQVWGISQPIQFRTISISSCDNRIHSVKQTSITPLLHWERIEQILEGMGYYLSVVDFEKEDPNVWETEDYQAYVCVKNKKDKQYKEWYGHSKTRQEAVQRAVIELGKEASNEKD